VFGTVLTGCGTAHSPLEGTEWRLVSWTLSSLYAPQFNITARFAGGMVSGFSGVNEYSGPCRARADGAFMAGFVTSTLKAGPEAAKRAEGAYLALLREATSFRLEGDTLTFYDANGNVSLIFERLQPE